MRTNFYNMETHIDKLATDVVQLLSTMKLMAATAESCTGGLLSAAFTSVSGSSSVFGLGKVTYGNEFKISELGVKAEIIKAYGAVSAETALEMAKGIRKAANSDIAVSVTGIAGPDGGNPAKPVGTVYFAAVSTAGDRILHLRINAENLPPDLRRKYIRLESVRQALILIKNEITFKE